MMSLDMPSCEKVFVFLEEMDMRCELAESWVGWPFKMFNRGWQPPLQSKPHSLNSSSPNELHFKEKVFSHTVRHTGVKLPKLRRDTRNFLIKMKALRELLDTSKDILPASQTSSVLWCVLWAGKGVELQPGRGWVFSPGPCMALITPGKIFCITGRRQRTAAAFGTKGYDRRTKTIILEKLWQWKKIPDGFKRTNIGSLVRAEGSES